MRIIKYDEDAKRNMQNRYKCESLITIYEKKQDDANNLGMIRDYAAILRCLPEMQFLYFIFDKGINNSFIEKVDEKPCIYVFTSKAEITMWLKRRENTENLIAGYVSGKKNIITYLIHSSISGIKIANVNSGSFVFSLFDFYKLMGDQYENDEDGVEIYFNEDPLGLKCEENPFVCKFSTLPSYNTAKMIAVSLCDIAFNDINHKVINFVIDEVKKDGERVKHNLKSNTGMIDIKEILNSFEVDEEELDHFEVFGYWTDLTASISASIYPDEATFFISFCNEFLSIKSYEVYEKLLDYVETNTLLLINLNK